MKKIIPALCLAALSSCSPFDRNRNEAEAIVRAQLMDPESARFGSFYFNERTRKACLTVNAKNSMGGYTGDQQAYVDLGNKGQPAFFNDMSVAICREAFADAEAN